MKKPLLLVAVLSASCVYTSVPPQLSPAAHNSRGVQGQLILRDGVRIDGELLEVGDAALTILAPTRLFVAPFSEISQVEFGLFRSSRLSSRPSVRTLDEGHRASRFPVGMPAVARDTILKSIGQTRPDTLRAGRR